MNYRNFIKTTNVIAQESEDLSWEIPDKADKLKGDLGLLPEDTQIKTWAVPQSTALFLRFLALAVNAQVFLELGASIGYSTCFLGLAAAELGGQVTTTEIFNQKAQLARVNLAKAGVADTVTLLEEDILATLEHWSSDVKIDLVFMDADKQRYHLYLQLIWERLKDGGLIVVDNVGDYPQHMPLFLEAVALLTGSATHFLNIDHGLLLIVKGRGENLIPYLGGLC